MCKDLEAAPFKIHLIQVVVEAPCLANLFHVTKIEEK